MATFKDIPQAGDVLATSQGDLEGNFSYFNTTLSKEHQIAFTDSSGTASEGRHKYVTLQSQALSPFSPGDSSTTGVFQNSGSLYALLNTNQNVRLTDSTSTSYTNGASSGSTVLPCPSGTGPLIMKWGQVASGGATTVVSFSGSFASAPVSIAVTQLGGAFQDQNLVITNILVSGFTISNSKPATTYSYIAIGN